MIQTLLLNDNYQIIAFISDKRAIKLILKNKVEVLSLWDGRKIISSGGFINHPATLRMKYHIPLIPTKLSFSRKLILRRDRYTCAYCAKKFSTSCLTIDHIVPKSMGGENSFSNCITACIGCNSKKSNKSLIQSGMSLKYEPVVPNKYLCCFPNGTIWHDDWVFYDLALRKPPPLWR